MNLNQGNIICNKKENTKYMTFFTNWNKNETKYDILKKNQYVLITVVQEFKNSGFIRGSTIRIPM